MAQARVCALEVEEQSGSGYILKVNLVKLADGAGIGLREKRQEENISFNKTLCSHTKSKSENNISEIDTSI